MNIAIGLFESSTQAQAAFEELQNTGVSQQHLTVVVNNGTGEYDYFTGAETALHNEGDISGATIATAPGHARTLLGHDAVTTPGGNSNIAIGPLWGLKEANLDILAGGILGGLVGAGVPDVTASYLMEGIRRGGTLVMAEVPESLTETASAILDRHEAINLQARVTSWIQRGWDPYHTDTTPYTPEEIQRERVYYDEVATVPVANHI